MTDDDRPQPPAALEPSLRDALVDLAKRDPESLPAVAAYAADLAAWVESDRSDAGSDETADGGTGSSTAEASASDGSSADASDSTSASDSDGYPPGVPEHATVTVTEIAGTKYRYYQWREGDEIRSETVELSSDDVTDHNAE